MNIGWSKKVAKAKAKALCTIKVDAYAQKEEHFWTGGSHQWVVVLQERQRKKGLIHER